MSVTEAAPDAEWNFARLIASLDDQDTEIDLVVTVRDDAGRGAPGSLLAPPDAHGRVLVHRLAAPHKIALSVARNLALGYARRVSLLDDASVVAFPDDDCRYPSGLLPRVLAQLTASGCACVTGAVGPSADQVDHRRFPRGDARLTPRLIMRTGCSGSMFFTARAVRRIGDFDTRLGLGAPYGSSEDADYLLRALALGLHGAYRPGDVVVEHPYKAGRPAEYYVGNVAVLAKHAHRRGGTRLLLARRLLGGLLLASQSRLPLADLGRALGALRALLGEPQPLGPDAAAVAGDEPPPFALTTSAAVDLDLPLFDVPIADAGSGEPYARALVLVRLHEQPLGVVAVDVGDRWLRAPDIAAAILRELSTELADHLERNACSALRHSGAPPAAGYGSAVRCPGAHRSRADRLPGVAVIVPTAGRPDDLRRCLERLVVLDYPRLEILVVDNRPGEDATRLVVGDAAAADPRIRYVAEHRPGSSVARNRGVAETRAELVAFTDDDVTVDPLWLRWLIEPFVADPQVELVTGMVLPSSYDTPAQQRFEEHSGFGRGYTRRIWDTGPHRPSSQLLFPYWGAPFGAGNSMAFRRAALLAIGGFDPALGAGSLALAGGDIESFAQILVGGGRLVYEPRAIVWHDHRRDDDALARQLFNYRVGATAILTKWLLRDPRTALALARAAGSVTVGAARSRLGGASAGQREVARLGQQLVASSQHGGIGRAVGGYASGPALYLRSRRWARRHGLDLVLTEAWPPQG